MSPIGTPGILNNPVVTVHVSSPPNDLHNVLSLEFEASLVGEVESVFVSKEVSVSAHRSDNGSALDDLLLDLLNSLDSAVSEDLGVFVGFSLGVGSGRGRNVLARPRSRALRDKTLFNSAIERGGDVSSILAEVIVVT